MNVKIKKLHPNAVIPTYAKDGDAGMDLTAVSITHQLDTYTGYIEYNTGIAVKIPEGYVGFIFPRSSISNTTLFMANAVGVVDSGYVGEIKVRMKSDPNPLFVDVAVNSEELSKEEKDFFMSYREVMYNVGDKVAQLIIMPYPQIEFEEVDELSETDRGEGGFGHSGK